MILCYHIFKFILLVINDVLSLFGEIKYFLQSQVNVAFHGVVGFEDHPTIPLCMEKGDTVFLHPLVLHGSGVNTTKVKQFLPFLYIIKFIGNLVKS